MSTKYMAQRAPKKAQPVRTEAAKKGKRTGGEHYVLRTSEGKLLSLRTSASSVEVIERAAARYSKAMKRLAKR
jgi:hypothetical protein